MTSLSTCVNHLTNFELIESARCTFNYVCDTVSSVSDSTWSKVNEYKDTKLFIGAQLFAGAAGVVLIGRAVRDFKKGEQKDALLKMGTGIACLGAFSYGDSCIDPLTGLFLLVVMAGDQYKAASGSSRWLPFKS